MVTGRQESGHGAAGRSGGAPPLRAGTTRLYLSGLRAGEVARLFTDTALEPVIVDDSPVAASALKMAYAAWTKGSAALLLGTLASARATGVDAALLAEWRRSQPDLPDRALRAADSAAGFHEAAAEMYQRAARDDGRG